jgi:soluble lytic murein transglycosylase
MKFDIFTFGYAQFDCAKTIMSRVFSSTQLTIAGTMTAALFSSVLVSAAVESVSFSSSDVLPRLRWIYGNGEAPKGTGLDGLLVRVKKAQIDGDWKNCVTSARSARSKAKSLQPWLSVIELDCASHFENSTATNALLKQTLDFVKVKPDWFIKGAQIMPLRSAYIKASLIAFERNNKLNRPLAWNNLDDLEEVSAFMDDKQKATMWSLAGELAFLQQKTEAARDFYRRSLNLNDTDDARTKLRGLDAVLASPGKTTEAKTGARTEIAANPGLEATPAEMELVDRATSELKAGDLVSAVGDAVKLIVDYPGGSRAKWASERVFEAYLSLIDKTEPKYQLLRSQIMKQIEKVDGDRLAEWARLLYNRGQWEDSLTLARRSLSSIQGARSTKTLELAGEAALACDKFDIAQEMFSTLIEHHAGTPSAREAMLRSGLLHYRQAQYGQAAAELERLLVIPQNENYELSARYWLWRSLQKTKSERAAQIANDLMTKFPFSYYGLRARFERNGNLLEWKIDRASQDVVESHQWLTTKERISWEKTQQLLKVGWLEEAQAELKELPPVFKADDRAVRSLLWAASGQYQIASRLANDAWDEKAELRRPPFTQSVFPTEFMPTILAQAELRQLSPELVQGLIKQESAYNVKAISSSNAFGLMQMIGPTAKEVASELHMGSLVLPEQMFQPQRNIQMGTYYLSRLITKYQGSVPLGLASYNAGPARIDRWIKARPSLKAIPGLHSSDPDNELWFDEIPYAETSYYVKAILRNVLLYRVLARGKVQVGDPIW